MKIIELKSFSIRNPSARVLRRMLAISAFILGLSAIPAAADDNGCSNATLKGDYGFTIDGNQPNSDGPQLPLKGVAITHFDGAGKLTQRDFVVTGGVLNPGQEDAEGSFHFTTGETGSYSLSSDCTGRMEIDLNAPVPPGSGLSPGVIKLMIVVTHHGNAIHTVVAEVTPPFATAPSSPTNTTSSDAWKINRDCDHDHE
jgi:hypothetical protein